MKKKGASSSQNFVDETSHQNLMKNINEMNEVWKKEKDINQNFAYWMLVKAASINAISNNKQYKELQLKELTEPYKLLPEVVVSNDEESIQNLNSIILMHDNILFEQIRKMKIPSVVKYITPQFISEDIRYLIEITKILNKKNPQKTEVTENRKEARGALTKEVINIINLPRVDIKINILHDRIVKVLGRIIENLFPQTQTQTQTISLFNEKFQFEKYIGKISLNYSIFLENFKDEFSMEKLKLIFNDKDIKTKINSIDEFSEKIRRENENYFDKIYHDKYKGNIFFEYMSLITQKNDDSSLNNYDDNIIAILYKLKENREGDEKKWREFFVLNNLFPGEDIFEQNYLTNTEINVKKELEDSFDGNTHLELISNWGKIIKDWYSNVYVYNISKDESEKRNNAIVYLADPEKRIIIIYGFGSKLYIYSLYGTKIIEYFFDTSFFVWKWVMSSKDPYAPDNTNIVRININPNKVGIIIFYIHMIISGFLGISKFEDYLKQRGMKQGFWNSPESPFKTWVEEVYFPKISSLMFPSKQ